MRQSSESILSDLLVTGGGTDQAPVKTERHGVWHELLVAVGDDNTAHVTLDDETLQALSKRAGIAVEDYVQGIDPFPTDVLRGVTDTATSPGNYDYDPYLLGMANGLLLAESILHNTEYSPLETPEVFLCDEGVAEPLGAKSEEIIDE